MSCSLFVTIRIIRSVNGRSYEFRPIKHKVMEDGFVCLKLARYCNQLLHWFTPVYSEYIRTNNWYVILVSYNKMCTYACLHTYISTAEIKSRFTVLCTALSREFVLPQIPVDEVYKVHSILIFIFYFSMVSISPLSISTCTVSTNRFEETL